MQPTIAVLWMGILIFLLPQSTEQSQDSLLIDYKDNYGIVYKSDASSYGNDDYGYEDSGGEDYGDDDYGDDDFGSGAEQKYEKKVVSKKDIKAIKKQLKKVMTTLKSQRQTFQSRIQSLIDVIYRKGKPERSAINPIQQMKCILLHLHSHQLKGALLPKNKVTCSIAHSMARAYGKVYETLKQISFNDIKLEPFEQKATPESTLRKNATLSKKQNLIMYASIDGVWEGELTGTGSPLLGWIFKTKPLGQIYARILRKTKFTFFPDNKNCGFLGELKIVTEDYSGKSACEREGILVHCTASNPSSPWHNFKSDTTNWRTADGSQICTNEGGFLPWARNNVPWVKSMVAAGAVQITGTGKTVTLIGRPNKSQKP